MVILQEKKDYEKNQFSSERMRVVEVGSLDEFGHYVALDLLLWIDKNPAGVISLPTGRTPESFIRALEWYKQNWSSAQAQKNIQKWGINSTSFPQTKDLRFVQMDEFLWMSPENVHSYASYLTTYYFKILEIDKKNCLLMDFSKMGFDLDRVKKIVHEQGDYQHCLQNSYFQNALKGVELFCEKYERAIQNWGGIGYFLGGIGLDGHIAFNISGSSIDSVTRIVELNKKSKAGFKRPDAQFDRAITIGLRTIFQNTASLIVLGAVGKEKSEIVQKVVEGKVTNKIPASFVQTHAQNKFVVTKFAAERLSLRNQNSVKSLLDQVVIQSALRSKKKIVDLVFTDFESGIATTVLEKIKDDFENKLAAVVERIQNKIDAGLTNWGTKKVLHTAPHHDDIMLGYYPIILRNQAAEHHMMYVVSGSNGVSDQFLHAFLKKNNKDSELIKWYEKQGDFVGNNSAVLEKMKIREQEDEQLWTTSGLKYGISHMRSPFYNASYFKSQPTYEFDVVPCLELIENFSPEVIFILHDSEFQGPSAHHVSFKILMEAIKHYQKPVQLFGYRNVWDRYQIFESELIVPVSQDEYNLQHQRFIECFASQKKALYPSKNGSKPFSLYAQQIQKYQYQELVILLGKDYFENHPNSKIKSAVGFVFFEKVGS